MSDLYERQDLVEGIDVNQIITIVGCGGIGFWVAKFLAMSGIKIMYIFDSDVIENNNLNRLDLPDKYIGENKTVILKLIINNIRPSCTVYNFPFELKESHPIKGNFLIDCTDRMDSQLFNQKIAKNKGMKYVKAGYDGTHISIHNSVAEWGEAEDGYTKTPSWVCPAVIIASLTAAKVLKYQNKELTCDIKDLYVKK